MGIYWIYSWLVVIYSDYSVVLWEVLLLVVIKSPYATVNGSNSAGKLTIEVSQGESVPIRCSAYNMAP